MLRHLKPVCVVLVLLGFVGCRGSGNGSSATATPTYTIAPTSSPTKQPTLRPTPRPTRQPTQTPTRTPTATPTRTPTPPPTVTPTAQPLRVFSWNHSDLNDVDGFVLIRWNGSQEVARTYVGKVLTHQTIAAPGSEWTVRAYDLARNESADSNRVAVP